MVHTLTILDAGEIARALRRMAGEILEHNPDPAAFALVGIPLRGPELARRLADLMMQIEGRRPHVGAVDVSMHRDDLKLRRSLRSVHPTELPFQVEDLTLILVDDVLFTGRTCRAAMDAISSFGRPARIQLAALLDRGHRELPIQPDYVGKSIRTARHELIKVRLESIDHEPDSVHLQKPAP
ncbi:MAG: bifunctional pyr operon transcriptional regulator/uracil phosphoribosyltransferase PyrR [Verrucomicrobia bacterium]|nr:bifunctional pyr operon transcriptional regulator/uracil phosphoribosyltransferase PyrR [Verrucomicrobiota bacterium]